MTDGGGVKEEGEGGVQGGVVVSSDQHRPWAVIPGLAQHPQAAGQTHTQFVTTPAGRLVRGSTCGFVWISTLIIHIFSRMFFGR